MQSTQFTLDMKKVLGVLQKAENVDVEDPYVVIAEGDEGLTRPMFETLMACLSATKAEDYKDLALENVLGLYDHISFLAPYFEEDNTLQHCLNCVRKAQSASAGRRIL